jgi:polysaccharide pyruvyl transferase WcaK-like protein
MTFFAGARTHFSTVALSSSMPTLSFSFSTKPQRINRDIFSHDDCLYEPKYLDAVTSANHMSPMLNENRAIRLDLTERVPKVQGEAQNAR